MIDASGFTNAISLHVRTAEAFKCLTIFAYKSHISNLCKSSKVPL